MSDVELETTGVTMTDVTVPFTAFFCFVDDVGIGRLWFDLVALA